MALRSKKDPLVDEVIVQGLGGLGFLESAACVVRVKRMAVRTGALKSRMVTGEEFKKEGRKK